MKHTYIDSLLSEIQLLQSRVESLKESQKVPFSFFKESFKRTQEISRLLHELEFVQIEEMRGQMEKLVQFLSYTESAKEEVKKEAEVEPKIVAVETNKDEVAPKQEKQDKVEVDNVVDETDPKESPELSVAEEQEEQEQETSPIVEEDERYKPKPSTSKPVEKPKETTIPSPLPLHDKKSETVLADLVPKNKSLNDVQPVSQTIQDVKRSISLNDRFLFQRELFDNNREAMNTMLTKLQSFSSFNLAESYLERNTTWNFKDETVDKFMQMLKDSFR